MYIVGTHDSKMESPNILFITQINIKTYMLPVIIYEKGDI